MVWPIGQPSGESRDTAIFSRDLWMRLADEARIWVKPCGSIHLAHQDDEWAVLQEYAALTRQEPFSCELLTAAQVCQRSPAANPNGLRGGLYSPFELAVNPVEAIRQMPLWLEERFNVALNFGTPVTSARDGVLFSADGRRWDFDSIFVCTGADFRELFPEEFAVSDLKLCKLQMLRTVPQVDSFRINTHLASGLTLRHYKNFACCPSLLAVQRRIAAETPELDYYGIHVMASQTNQGNVILGDSHEYDDRIEPFDSREIEELMLRELRKIIELPDWTIESRWHGIYAKHSSDSMYRCNPSRQVFVRTGTGGAGMTMSFGLAARELESWN
jgi:FAD dependent oxidoreductase TIGR03364